ncbi:type II toxin-antitoxin system PemK/MazF family toxin [Xaviernesmea oryzae]|uniref:type II toxin-antitoxin system PemK/MazF family toxin n=1 Tax=Xaviernesmea oryzae TaxID=464029 RepID=UPI003077C832
MKRGEIVIVSAPGDYGKPRPAVVVQTNGIPENYPSIIVCQITSTLKPLPISASLSNQASGTACGRDRKS